MSYQIGKYTITNPYLGGGGQSHVVEAEAEGKLYALKLLTASADDHQALTRFDLEAEILKTIDHPNIVRYVEHGIAGQHRYIAMPKLPGRNLRFELADHRRIEPYRAIAIATQLATALQVFHQLGAVHRDVKPENVQLDDTSDHVWLLDAGYARYVQRTRITGSGCRKPGSEGYRAPETLRGYDYKQSDFFSLGVVLYEIITGQHPFDGRDPRRKQTAPSLRGIVPECPVFIENVVQRLLAWHVNDRPQTAAELLALLDDPARGFRVVRRSHLAWAENGALPLLFRLSDTNLSAVRLAAESRVRPDGYVATTTGAASEGAAAVAALAKRDLIVDPQLHQAAYTGFVSIRGFASTVCSENRDQPLTLEELRDPMTLRSIVQLALDVEAEGGATVKLVPGFVNTDASANGWLGCNSLLLDGCVEALPGSESFAVRVLASLESAPTPAARQRIAEALGRHRPELFVVSFDGLGANATAEQLLRALEIAKALQTTARCVIADAGAFAHLWFAFGLGVAVDLVAESPLSTRPYSWTPQRFEFPSILTSLRLDDAEKMLSTSHAPEIECKCFACGSAISIAERLSSAIAHNAAMASCERAAAMALSPGERQTSLRKRIDLARAIEASTAIGQWERRVERLDAIAKALDSAEQRLNRKAA